MSPKTGRPKTDNPKDIRFSIRLDGETGKKLDDYCEKNNVSKGEAVRKGLKLLFSKKE